MRISDWSSDVCSSDLFSSAFSPDRSGTRPASHRTFPNRNIQSIAKKPSTYRTLGLQGACDCHYQSCRSHQILVRGHCCLWCCYRHHRLLTRSEEHTSELQSLMRISYAVFCLKKNKQIKTVPTNKNQYKIHR